MKKLFALCLGIVIMLTVSGTGFAADQLVIATEGAYPPFNYIDPDGNIKGFDVEIADALCKQMGMAYKLVVQEWDGMIPGLLAKKYDVIVASMSITEKRKKAVNFTGHYYRVPARFVARKGAGFDVSKIGLKGKKIGVQRASTYANYLNGYTRISSRLPTTTRLKITIWICCPAVWMLFWPRRFLWASGWNCRKHRVLNLSASRCGIGNI